MEIPDRLLCLFSARVEEQERSYVVEVPERELEFGDVQEGSTYQIAVLPTRTEEGEKIAKGSSHDHPVEPPVEEGETRVVEIESLGDRGDGIARVERGYVVIVPDTEKGERVRIEITDVRKNVAFAEVVERFSYYE